MFVGQFADHDLTCQFTAHRYVIRGSMLGQAQERVLRKWGRKTPFEDVVAAHPGDDEGSRARSKKCRGEG